MTTETLTLQYQSQIAAAIKNMQWPAEPAELYEPVRYIMSLGGKRMRPMLAVIGCGLFNGDIKKVLRPAIALEVFHNFTLVHDDLMDNALVRRGKATVHNRWDMPTAILSGDVMLVFAYELMMDADENKLRSAIELFNSTARGVCEGQQLDMAYEIAEEIDEARYTKMIGLKTAVLLAASLEMGALIAGATQQERKNIYECGYQLGIAFQIQDDLLDSYGEAKTFGKKIGGDILAGKKTYLAVKAFELADESTAKKLHHLFGRSTLSDDQRIMGVLDIYDRLGVKNVTETARNSSYSRGISLLNTVNGDLQHKEMLISLAESLVHRYA
ncbi:MAG: polyprenyl synthetase family protein [Bacteroidota bacterium]|nr:polyprenyl synthetase family protein [Bacteroidota bacterium]